MADVHQPAVVQADVDKGAEVDNVEHRTQQFHAGLQVLELEHALLEKWLRQVLAGIAAGPCQLLNDVGQQQPADSQFSGEGIEIERRRPLGERLRVLPAGEILAGSAKPLQHLRGHLVALGMNPGGVQWLDPAGDLEKADRLHEGRFAEPRHLEQLPTGGERPVLGPPFVQVAGRGLVEAGDIPKQCRARRIHVDAHIVHAALHDRVERRVQMAGLDVVLVEADADVGRLNLHQFRKRILQPPTDRDRPADRGLVPRQFLTGIAAGRIDARARLVDDDIGDIEFLQPSCHQFGDERLGFPPRRAVADGHDRARMRRDHFDDLLRGGGTLLRLADDMENRVLERIAAFVDHHRLAAALETGIERQHAATGHRRLEQQVSQIPRKHLDGVRFAVVGHLPAEFAFEARQHQPGERIANAALEKFSVRMAGWYQHFLGRRLHFLDRPVDPDFQKLGTLAAVDRQNAVRWHPLDMLSVLEEVPKMLLILRLGLAWALHPLAGEAGLPVQDAAQPLPHIGMFAEIVGYDVPDAKQHVGHACHLGIRIQEVGRSRVEIGGGRIGRENLPCQRLEPPLSGNLGQGEFARLEGQVEILELLGACRRGKSGLQGRGQLSLSLDGSQDGLLPIGQLAGAAHALGDQANGNLVETAGLITAVAGDEGNGVSFVEQAHGRIDRRYRQPESLGNWPQIDERRGSHPTSSMHVPCEHCRPHNSTFPSPFHACTHGSLNETYDENLGATRVGCQTLGNHPPPPSPPMPPGIAPLPLLLTRVRAVFYSPTAGNRRSPGTCPGAIEAAL